MANNILEQIKKNLTKYRKHKRWNKIVSVMMALVVFVTTYALILPAITMEIETNCGLQEHIHTEECYEATFETKTELICNLPEIEDHIHDETCYETEKVLVCELTEEEIGHVYIGEDTEDVHIEEETEEAGHVHTEDCYEEIELLACDEEELEGHTHTEECYTTIEIEAETEEDQDQKLVCDLEEHEHTEECYLEENPDEYILTATTLEGITVVLEGPSSSFDQNLDELSLKVEELDPDLRGRPLLNETFRGRYLRMEEEERIVRALEILDTAIEEEELFAESKRLFDIGLWHGEEEVEPIGPVSLSFLDIEIPDEFDAKVYHIDEEKWNARDMEASQDWYGNIILDTDHFSIYAVVLLEEIMPMALPPQVTYRATWDNVANGVTLNLFDYKAYNSSWINALTDSTIRTMINTTNGQQGGDLRPLLFTPQGLTGTTINHFTGGATPRQGIVNSRLNNSGYPVLQAAGSNLEYLFNPSTPPSGDTRTNHTDLNGLFREDGNGNGYVVFDSDEEYARLNGKEFTFYETYGITQPEANPVGFFPFTNPDNARRGVQPGNGYYNHHFGLTMDADFIMPPGGKLTNGEDMIFEFSGDDDMWVFIDGRLVLDIGGIHQRVAGSINFATGRVEVNEVTQKSLEEIFGSAFTPGSNHNIKVFYLERGGIYSNLMIRMNLQFKKLPIDIPVEKLWEDKDNALGKRPESITVKLYADGEEIESLELSPTNNWKDIFKGLPVLDEDGKEIAYTIKEDPVPGYSSNITWDTENGFKITNSLVVGKLKIKKIDSEDINIVLPGVVFDIFTADDNWEKSSYTARATGTTDNNGILEFTDLAPGKYLLYESKAADGYYSITEPWKLTVDEEGQVTIEEMTPGPDGSFTIKNTKQGEELIVEKKWVDAEGNGLEGISQEVQVQLWRKWKPSAGSGSGHTVKFYVKAMTNQGKREFFVDERVVANGGAISFYGYLNWGVISPTKVSSEPNQNKIIGQKNVVEYLDPTPIYKVENITSDQKIVFDFGDVGLWDNAIKDVFRLGIEEITNPPTEPNPDPGEEQRELVDTITLNKANDWKYQWDKLPSKAPNGNPYYYYVEEIDPPPGFKVSYSDNNTNGVPPGNTITITNTSEYRLPETGGPGTKPYILAGSLLMATSLIYILNRFRKGGHRTANSETKNI